MHTNNVEVFLTSGYDLKYNEISNKLEFKKKTETNFQELRDYDIHSLVRQMNQVDIKIQKKDLGELLYSDFTTRYNPFIDYFHGLPSYDQADSDYIQDLANTVVVPPNEMEHWNLWFKKWMVAVVACALEERNVNQAALVLVGSQGIGMDITAYSLPLISEHSLPSFQSKVYQPGNVRLKLFQSNVYQLIN